MRGKLFNWLILTLLLGVNLPAMIGTSQDGQPPGDHLVQPGDTWAALGFRYDVDPAELRRLSGQMNQQREPVIGTRIALPPDARQQTGIFVRRSKAGLLEMSVVAGLSPWSLALSNQFSNPYRPAPLASLIVPDESAVPSELPSGFENLELSQPVATPGQALGIRAELSTTPTSIAAEIDGLPFVTTISGSRFVGVVGTGAFYAGGQPELMIRVDGQPAWSQPWQFGEKEWDYQSLTLTGEAAQIDQKARDEERARLKQLWTIISPEIQWDQAFQRPIVEDLGLSATFGGRRSYNGGPFLSYHEGVDFSAFAGTPVTAPAAGTVVLAEPLYVRGGAVILDHGLGIYTGYYHLSDIYVSEGQIVQPGDVLGGVGTTGLSTGNHLHWDLLINGVWVDALDWLDRDMACWIAEGIARPCTPSTTPENSP